MKPPRVALFQPYPHTWGGLQAVVASLARDLPAHDCVPVLIAPEEGKFADAIRASGLECLVCDPGPAWHVYGRGARSLSYTLAPGRLFGLLGYWWALSRQLKELRIDVLHCNDYRGVLLAAPAARLANIPALWHMHGFIPSKVANALCAALVERIVPVSAGMLDYLKVPAGWRPKIKVIHNGLAADSLELPPQPEKDRPPVVLAVGTLHPRKGYETLLRAFAEVVEKIPAAQCQIAGGTFGDGAYARTLAELVSSLGLQDQVQFLGSCNSVPALMQGATLLAVPSEIEAFGMVAIEAMRAGLPVVASRTGGLPEIVLAEETGLLFPPGNVSALAGAITRLLNDATLAQCMGATGRARVATEFTQEKTTSQFAELYAEMLQPDVSRAPARVKPLLIQANI